MIWKLTTSSQNIQEIMIQMEFMKFIGRQMMELLLKSLMHADGNIRYANYQSLSQMEEYLTAEGHNEIITDITL